MGKAFLFVSILFLHCPWTSLISQQVVVGNPSSTGYHYQPLNRSFDYAVSEMIYRQPEINQAGRITHIAFDKVSGSSSVSINNVSVYMKLTWGNIFSTSVWSTTGYTLVWSGSFPNGVSGYQEIELTTQFSYDNAQNLDILVVKDHQAYTVDPPFYRVTSTYPYNRTRCAAQQVSLPTALSGTSQRPNIRLTLVPEIPSPPLPAVFLYPQDTQMEVPINANLSWFPSETADGYKVYLSTQNPPLELVSTEPDTDYNPPFDFAQYTRYYWQVVPFNAGGDAVDCPVWTYRTYEPTPLPPGNVTFTADEADFILAWEAVTHDAEGMSIAPPYYFIYRSNVPYGLQADFEYLGYTSLVNYRLTGISPSDTRKFYHIRARLVLP